MTRSRARIAWIAERLATVIVIAAAGVLAVPLLDGAVTPRLRIAGAAAAAVIGILATLVPLVRPAPQPSVRREVYLRVTAIVLVGLLLTGVAYRLDGDPQRLIRSPGHALVALVVTVGFGAVLGELLSLAARALDAWRRRRRWRLSRPLPFWFFAVALLVLWLPAIILLSPGSVTYDGQRQIDELFGVRIPSLDFQYSPTNHHPWFATVWQGTLLKAGMAFTGGSIDGGLMLHSMVLVVLSLLTYAFLVRRIQSLAGPGWALVAVAYFGIVPHFANYAMLYEKTGWYQLALIWFILGVVDVVLRSGMRTALPALILGGLLTSLFRSNGVYIVAPTLIALGLSELLRRQPRRALTVGVSFVVVVGLFAGWTSVVLPRLGVEPASPGEALVIPFQQVARIVRDHPRDVTAAQRAAIDEVMPVDRLATTYTPEGGDPVKGLYEIDTFLITPEAIEKMKANPDWWKNDAYRQHLSAFIGVWLQLVAEHPLTAVSATVNNTFLYSSPGLGRGADVSLFAGGLTDYPVLANQYTPLYRHFAGETAVSGLVAYYGAWASVPGIDLLSNPGIYGWIVIALGISLLFWRRRSRLLLYIPIALIYFVNFAGARNGDFRYTVALLPPLVLCLAAWWAHPESGAAGDPVQRHVAPTEHGLEAGGLGRDADAAPHLG